MNDRIVLVSEAFCTYLGFTPLPPLPGNSEKKKKK